MSEADIGRAARDGLAAVLQDDIRSLRAGNRRLEAALREAEAKQAIDQQQYDDMTDTAGKLADENRRLREALEGLLMSADSSWEDDGVQTGHDWAHACRVARAALEETKQWTS